MFVKQDGVCSIYKSFTGIFKITSLHYGPRSKIACRYVNAVQHLKYIDVLVFITEVLSEV